MMLPVHQSCDGVYYLKFNKPDDIVCKCAFILEFGLDAKKKLYKIPGFVAVRFVRTWSICLLYLSNTHSDDTVLFICSWIVIL